MESALVGVAVLACPVGMGLMMWFMSKGMRKPSQSGVDEPTVVNVEALREEHQRLGEQIDRLEREDASEVRLRKVGS